MRYFIVSGSYIFNGQRAQFQLVEASETYINGKNIGQKLEKNNKSLYPIDDIVIANIIELNESDMKSFIN